MIQFITDGINGRGERVILWRLHQYRYELEIGSGKNKRSVLLTNTEYYDALDQFNATVENFQDMETV